MMKKRGTATVSKLLKEESVYDDEEQEMIVNDLRESAEKSERHLQAAVVIACVIMGVFSFVHGVYDLIYPEDVCNKLKEYVVSVLYGFEDWGAGVLICLIEIITGISFLITALIVSKIHARNSSSISSDGSNNNNNTTTTTTTSDHNHTFNLSLIVIGWSLTVIVFWLYLMGFEEFSTTPKAWPTIANLILLAISNYLESQMIQSANQLSNLSHHKYQYKKA